MTFQPQQARDDRSLGDLFGELTREISTLVRQEMQLAKVEMSQKFSSLGKDAGMIAAGAALAYAGLLALVAAVILGLWQAGLPAWASALLVGLIVASVGGFLAMSGLKAMKREDLVPRETIESLKEDVHGTQPVRRRAA